MKKIIYLLLILSLSAVFAGSCYALYYSLTSTIDVPGAFKTVAFDKDGNNIVGYYMNSHSGPSHGFLYDGTKYTTIDFPGASQTQVLGISGNKIVGEYLYAGGVKSYGFLYDGASYTTIAVPSAFSTMGLSIDGNNITGTYYDYANYSQGHGFFYDGTSYTTFDFPDASLTWATGIDGNNIVGNYLDDSKTFACGFLYDITNNTIKDITPLSAHGMIISDINGNNILGILYTGGPKVYRDFLFNGTYYSDLNIIPSALLFDPISIDGDTIVGAYWKPGSGYHGFVASPVPVPSAILLLGSGLPILLGLKRKFLRKLLSI